MYIHLCILYHKRQTERQNIFSIYVHLSDESSKKNRTSILKSSIDIIISLFIHLA